VLILLKINHLVVVSQPKICILFTAYIKFNKNLRKNIKIGTYQNEIPGLADGTFRFISKREFFIAKLT